MGERYQRCSPRGNYVPVAKNTEKHLTTQYIGLTWLSSLLVKTLEHKNEDSIQFPALYVRRLRLSLPKTLEDVR